MTTLATLTRWWDLLFPQRRLLQAILHEQQRTNHLLRLYVGIRPAGNARGALPNPMKLVTNPSPDAPAPRRRDERDVSVTTREDIQDDQLRQRWTARSTPGSPPIPSTPLTTSTK